MLFIVWYKLMGIVYESSENLSATTISFLEAMMDLQYVTVFQLIYE